jgi:isopentenyl diphosphate isomerase/L-lactate dehydrogenase-like FMN-dependent dehydrogenase
MKRFIQKDQQNCSKCHSGGYLKRKPMFDGLDLKGVKINTPKLTWDFINRLKGETDMKVVLKGIVTREDARLCLSHGIDGIIVSNHGGRSVESGRATLDSLPEVVEAVDGNIPVLVDGGFRRGTDIFKALALGAKGVCVCRPYLWGLAAFGQAGVEKVLDILRAELALTMKFAGTPSLRKIKPTHVGFKENYNL